MDESRPLAMFYNNPYERFNNDVFVNRRDDSTLHVQEVWDGNISESNLKK